jgi:hypothetical protein
MEMSKTKKCIACGDPWDIELLRLESPQILEPFCHLCGGMALDDDFTHIEPNENSEWAEMNLFEGDYDDEN